MAKRAAASASSEPRLTVFITGGSRGIGLAIGVKLASALGANVVLAAKTATPHAKLPGTIYSAADEIVAAGGRALPVECDVRSEEAVERALALAVETFGGIDILINNASAISLTGTVDTPMKKYDLMNSINARGTYMCSRLALPYLSRSRHAHILNISPPLNMHEKWFMDHTAYTMAKYGMSMCTLGMAAEFADHGIAVNSLWPATAIETAALKMVGGIEAGAGCRNTAIMADAALVILQRKPREATGRFFVDEVVLRETGVTDFEKYSVVPGTTKFIMDYFLEPHDLVPRRSKL